jgi:hypothetical protein
MKVLIGKIAIVAFIFFSAACSNKAKEKAGYLHKDLSEQMDALSILQGSIGEELNQRRTEDLLWYVNGLDSVMQIIMQDLNNHHSLEKPFDHFYKTKMEVPIQKLRIAIGNGDTVEVRKSYTLLVGKCNSCHNLHGVEERAHY